VASDAVDDLVHGLQELGCPANAVIGAITAATPGTIAVR